MPRQGGGNCAAKRVDRVDAVDEMDTMDAAPERASIHGERRTGVGRPRATWPYTSAQ